MSLSNMPTCHNSFTDGFERSLLSWLTDTEGNGGKSTYLFRICHSFCGIPTITYSYALPDFCGNVSLSTKVNWALFLCRVYIALSILT